MSEYSICDIECCWIIWKQRSFLPIHISNWYVSRLIHCFEREERLKNSKMHKSRCCSIVRDILFDNGQNRVFIIVNLNEALLEHQLGGTSHTMLDGCVYEVRVKVGRTSTITLRIILLSARRMCLAWFDRGRIDSRHLHTTYRNAIIR